MEVAGKRQPGSHPRIIDANPAPPQLVSVVCPMFNEGDQVAPNLKRLAAKLSELPYAWEIVLVNDGSTDGSLAAAREAAETVRQLRIVTYNRNRGRGFAIRSGLLHARGDVVVATESDLSWGEDIVGRLVDELVSGDYDAVVASPHRQGGALENVPIHRVLYTRFGNFLLRRLMPVQLTMYTGMTRAYRANAIYGLPLEADDKELHLEILSKLAATGAKIGEIPATLRWPPGRKAKSSFSARKYIGSHLIFGLGEAQTLLLLVLSGAITSAGVLLGLYLAALSLGGTPVAGRPALFASVLMTLLGFLSLVSTALSGQTRRLERELLKVRATLHVLQASRERSADE